MFVWVHSTTPPILSVEFWETLYISKGWKKKKKVMEIVRYLWHGFIHGVQHICIFNIVAPSFITFCQMFGRRRTLSTRPSLLMFRIDRPIARIISSFVLYRVPRSGPFTWRRYRNRMDLYRVSTVVSGSPIACGTRGPWQQQWCDSLQKAWRMMGFCIATCFTQSPKTFFCTTTSCHYNFETETLVWYCKHGLRTLALSLWKSTFYTLQ